MATAARQAGLGRTARRLGVLVVALLVAAGGLAFWHFLVTAPDETDPSPVRLTIGEEALIIPGNLIRFADQRRDMALPRVDLALLWPHLLGRTPETAAALDELGDGSRAIQLSIEPRDTDMDASGRLASIYVRYLEPGEEAGPAGLVRRRFLPDTAYTGETLYFEPGATRPFVTRCFPRAGDGADDLCLSEFRLGRTLIAAYRFRPALLADWRLLRQQIEARAAGLLAP
jgi:hypothetical protein